MSQDQESIEISKELGEQSYLYRSALSPIKGSQTGKNEHYTEFEITADVTKTDETKTALEFEPSSEGILHEDDNQDQLLDEEDNDNQITVSMLVGSHEDQIGLDEIIENTNNLNTQQDQEFNQLIIDYIQNSNELRQIESRAIEIKQTMHMQLDMINAKSAQLSSTINSKDLISLHNRTNANNTAPNTTKPLLDLPPFKNKNTKVNTEAKKKGKKSSKISTEVLTENDENQAMSAGAPVKAEKPANEKVLDEMEFMEKRELYKLNEIKPPYSWICLVRQAIIELDLNWVSYKQIFDWIEESFAYYRSPEKETYKNNLRLAIAHDKCFFKEKFGQNVFYSINDDEYEKYKQAMIARKKERKSKSKSVSENSNENQGLVSTEKLALKVDTSFLKRKKAPLQERDRKSVV